MPSNGTALLAALKAEFADNEPEILLLEHPPAVFSAPSVVVSPSEPFLEPDTHGMVRERWDVLVVVAMKEKGIGVDQMRDLSLRVFRAARSVGAVWRRASGPRRPQGDDARALVLVVNELDFKTDPTPS